ncbi:MAG: SRPBCC domain-containing protein [Myxococcales bacterium]|nr:SRPBCC domain-containing protein [Myxococcales bacterium]
MIESAEAASITIVRVIAAPVAAVFEAWTDPACLQQWLAPNPCSVAEASADVRLGGRYRVVAVDPLGNRHVTTGEYRELVRDVRLVKTWVYEGPNYADPYPTLLTVDFREVGPASTEISLRQDQLLAPEDRAGNREGWRLCFEKLEALLRPTV